MTSHNDDDLLLTIIDEESGTTVVDVPVQKTGDGPYRLLATPLLEESVFYRDVIKLDERPDGIYRFGGLAQKSGFRVYDYLLSQDIIESDEFRALLDEIVKHDGAWEQILGGLILIHIPESSSLDIPYQINALIG